MTLRPFQREFVAGVLRPGTKRAALSTPRGNGKSWLAGCIGADALSPGGALFEAGAENVLLSGSFDQARYVFRFAKEFLGEEGYSYLDSTNKLAIRHKATGTRLLVRSSRAKGAFGIVGARIAIAEEPGAWDTIGGELMNAALDTSLGNAITLWITRCGAPGIGPPANQGRAVRFKPRLNHGRNKMQGRG